MTQSGHRGSCPPQSTRTESTATGRRAAATGTYDAAPVHNPAERDADPTGGTRPAPRPATRDSAAKTVAVEES
ncbi:hypothetical protein [Kitasatospora purpeofusca]|uniref:hypothetical protein n=1 Tax=Kitasatospora purpeofusca TaxID=67352 RepID=UPI00380057BE